MVFILKSSEIRPDDLVKLDSGNGDFYVCAAGAAREADKIIFYGDELHQFFFYVNWISKANSTHDIDVFSATNKKLGGGMPRFESEALQIIQKNIEYLFRSRCFRSFSSPIIETEIPSKIIFSWGVSL